MVVVNYGEFITAENRNVLLHEHHFAAYCMPATSQEWLSGCQQAIQIETDRKLRI